MERRRYEYGGYLPLELPDGREYYDEADGLSVCRLNCGRNAVVVALQLAACEKVFIPYYNCNVVRDALTANGIAFDYYLLDDDFMPKVETLGANEWLLYVNYFGGALRNNLEQVAQRYQRVVFDNTQAFYAKPVVQPACFNVYSPRKFFGVADGAYLVWSDRRLQAKDYPPDVSWDRASFLLKSLELGTNAAYHDNLRSEEDLGEGVKAMSALTQAMLSSIDYLGIREKRLRNIQVARNLLDSINELDRNLDGDLMVYPLLVTHDDLRHNLVSERVYVPQWWKYLLDVVPQDSLEHRLSTYLLPLPIDQRYCEQDIEELCELVLSLAGK